MSAAGDARERQQTAQAPVSRPNAAPVDSGAIGRLSERQRAEIGWAVERDWQLRDQRDDWDGLHAAVERIVREHTDRALAEAWDEGYSCGLGDYGKDPARETCAANPYRAAREEQ